MLAQHKSSKIHSFDFYTMKYAPKSLQASVLSHMESADILEVYQDTKMYKGYGRWLISLPVGLWTDRITEPNPSRESDDINYLNFINTYKGKGKGRGFLTRDVIVHDGLRFFNERALRALHALRPELILLGVAARMLAEFSAFPKQAVEELRAFKRRTRAARSKAVWSPQEDNVLGRWFKRRVGNKHLGDLSDQEWQAVIDGLNGQRRKSGIRRRLKTLNKNLYHKLLEEQDKDLATPRGRLTEAYAVRYMKEALGERPRMPPITKPSKQRSKAPPHCPSCGHDLTKKRSQRVPSASQGLSGPTPALPTPHEQLSFGF